MSGAVASSLQQQAGSTSHEAHTSERVPVMPLVFGIPLALTSLHTRTYEHTERGRQEFGRCAACPTHP